MNAKLFCTARYRKSVLVWMTFLCASLVWTHLFFASSSSGNSSSSNSWWSLSSSTNYYYYYYYSSRSITSIDVPRTAQGKQYHHGKDEYDDNEITMSWEEFIRQQQNTTEQNISLRALRFPSVEERLKMYLSDWYLPPCPGNNDNNNNRTKANDSDHDHESNKHLIHYKYNSETKSHLVHVYANDSATTMHTTTFNFSTLAIQSDVAFSLDLGTLQQYQGTQKEYIVDIQKTLLPALAAVHQWEVTHEAHIRGHVPILMQFGDSSKSKVHGYLTVPHIKKFRQAMTPQQIDRITTTPNGCKSRDLGSKTMMQPIIWKLQTERHLGMLPKVTKSDIPWKLKRPQAIFRGSLTGISNFDHKDAQDDVERCMRVPRCRLVYENANSTLLDAQLTNTFHFVPNMINQVTLVGPRKKVESLLRYKAIIFLEGNDVSSGLKWALYSKSVVLMPRPTKTSWIMEERLQPWVHYVPIRSDLSNVLEQVQWVLDHDAEAERIAQRGRLWMLDLLFHPMAAHDDQIIYQSILQHYRNHFFLDQNQTTEFLPKPALNHMVE